MQASVRDSENPAYAEWAEDCEKREQRRRRKASSSGGRSRAKAPRQEKAARPISYKNVTATGQAPTSTASAATRSDSGAAEVPRVPGPGSWNWNGAGKCWIPYATSQSSPRGSRPPASRHPPQKKGAQELEFPLQEFIPPKFDAFAEQDVTSPSVIRTAPPHARPKEAFRFVCLGETKGKAAGSLVGKFEERIAKAKPPPPPPKPPMGPPPPPRIAKAKESIVALPRERVPQKQCPRTGPPPPQRSATATMAAIWATWSTGPPPPGPPPPPRIAKAKESGVDTTWYDTATRKRSATTTRVRVPQMYPGPPTGPPPPQHPGPPGLPPPRRSAGTPPGPPLPQPNSSRYFNYRATLN